MSIYFVNNGKFNPTAMLTFGVSAKKAEDAIGRFGTGFKYSVAVILRLGGSVKVESCGNTYSFGVIKESIRGKEFDVVHMNGERVGFTTHFGMNWEPWMAYRELYCNAKDEGGSVCLSLDTEWDTVITVDCTPIEAIYEERDEHFISTDPLIEGEDVDIHQGSSEYIYYQGVRVKELDRPSAFTYNIKSYLTLTEERMAAYYFQVDEAMAKAVQLYASQSQLREIFNKGNYCQENFVSYPPHGLSQDYKNLCSELLNTEKGIPENARVLLGDINNEIGNWPKFTLTDIQEQAFEKAVVFLKGINVDVTEFPINFVTGLGDCVMGRAFEGEIYLSSLPFDMGVKQVASTLLEEWVHIKLGCDDFDRKMQNYLFDKILSLGEEINQGCL